MRPRTPENPVRSSAPTRHALTLHRRRVRRARLLGITGMAATAVVAGTGFAVSTATGGTAFGLPAATSSLTSSAAAQDVTVTETRGDRLSVHAGSAVSRETADTVAKLALTSGTQIAREADGKVATTALTTSLASLQHYRTLNADTVLARVATTQDAAAAVDAAAVAADQRAAAAARAAEAKAQAIAQAKADAIRQAAANTPAGAKATARALMSSEYGWGDAQYTCLVSLWTKESGWNYKAYNPSGATGIPQALPGSKMATVAADWSTNATTQVIWGLRYISGSYGTPCAAWAHSQSVNWY